MLKIVHIPNKVLISPTQQVQKFDSYLKKLVLDMEETLVAQIDPQGVGLAATQVGLSLAIFIMKPARDADTEVCVNPRILELDWNEPVVKAEDSKKKKKDTPLEGCLSIPKFWSPVKRAYRTLVEYQDITGKVHKKWFSGFKSIIVQHEVDHLNGILFTQRALEQDVQMYEEKKDELVPVKF
jgi:peptide deformylase